MHGSIEKLPSVSHTHTHAHTQGNPRYQSQVYNALVALLSSTSSEAQRMAAYTLRLIQPAMGVASTTIVDPVLELLQSLHLDVQYEGVCGGWVGGRVLQLK